MMARTGQDRGLLEGFQKKTKKRKVEDIMMYYSVVETSDAKNGFDAYIGEKMVAKEKPSNSMATDAVKGSYVKQTWFDSYEAAKDYLILTMEGYWASQDGTVAKEASTTPACFAEAGAWK